MSIGEDPDLNPEPTQPEPTQPGEGDEQDGMGSHTPERRS